MRQRMTFAATLAAVFVAVTPAIGAPPDTKLRVLLTYGGHDFQEKEFFAMWDALPGVVYTKAPLPQSADMLKPGLEKDFDVVVCYDMAKEFTPEQQRNLLALLDRGIGYVALHHNLSGNLEWAEYHKVIGGTWLWKKRTIDGREYGPSTYEHGQRIPVKVADSSHPITKGIQDFVIHDETYGNTYVDPSVHVLLRAENPRNVGPFLWVKPHGKSRIVYFQAGHDAEAWKHPAFQEVLRRSINWAAQGDR